MKQISEPNLSKKSLKGELIILLEPMFGESIRKLIDEYYDDERPAEIIDLAKGMLTDYMGEANAKKAIQKLLEKIQEKDLSAKR